MIIPRRIIDFLENATLAVAGTRDSELVPRVHRPSGWAVSGGGKALVCFFPDVFAEGLRSALANNGEIAVTISEAPSHETYQIKGSGTSFGTITPEDLVACEACRDRAVERLSLVLGIDEDALRDCLPEPVLRVEVEVREIFDQTPGPDAGRRLSEEA